MSTPESVTIVERLVAAGIISRADRERALTLASQGGPTAPRRTRLLIEISGYVGGVLVLAAVALFLVSRWSSLEVAGRIAVVGGAAALLAGAAIALVVASGGPVSVRAPAAHPRRRLAGALLVGAGILTGAAADITARHLLDWAGTRQSVLVFGGALAVFVLGHLLAPSALGVLAVAGGWVALTSAVASGDEGRFAYGLFSAMTASGALALVVLAESGRLMTRQVTRLAAGGLAFLAGQSLLGGGESPELAYIALGVLAVLAFTGYALSSAWPYLATGVVAATAAATEAAVDLGRGSLGVAGVLLVAGVVLLLTSLVGTAIHRGRGAGPDRPAEPPSLSP